MKKLNLWMILLFLLLVTSCGGGNNEERSQIDRDYAIIGSLLHQYCPDYQHRKNAYVNHDGDTARLFFINESTISCKPSQNGEPCIPYIKYTYSYDFLGKNGAVGSLRYNIEYLYYDEILTYSSDMISQGKYYDFGEFSFENVPLSNLKDSLVDVFGMSNQNYIKYAKHKGPIEFNNDCDLWKLIE